MSEDAPRDVAGEPKPNAMGKPPLLPEGLGPELTSAGGDRGAAAAAAPKLVFEDASTGEGSLENTLTSDDGDKEFSFGTTKAAPLPAQVPPDAPPSPEGAKARSAAAQPSSFTTLESANGSGPSEQSPPKKAEPIDDGDADSEKGEFTFGTTTPIQLPDFSQLPPPSAGMLRSSGSTPSSACPPQIQTSTPRSARDYPKVLPSVMENAIATPPASRPPTPPPLPPSTPPQAMVLQPYVPPPQAAVQVQVPAALYAAQPHLQVQGPWCPPELAPQMQVPVMTAPMVQPQPVLQPVMQHQPVMQPQHVMQSSYVLEHQPQDVHVLEMSADTEPPPFGPYFGDGDEKTRHGDGSAEAFWDCCDARRLKLLGAVTCVAALLVAGAMLVAAAGSVR
mmetsp:Transcript_79472/g.199772  ORF Transcript_79472/g.199772 Transcript_79472/m.199772 type:complete len:391 (-) Transcript_79472:17-1189(-)